MKTLKKYLKPVAIALSFLILMQGCTLYKVGYVTLDEASKAETKVKVETKSGEKFKFKRIGIENGEYYGVKKSKGDIVKVPLNIEWHNEVIVKDQTLSTIGTIIIPIIFLFTVGAVYYDGNRSNNKFPIPLHN